MTQPRRLTVDWRTTLALIWAGVCGLFYARMVITERFPTLLTWFRR